MAAKKNCINLDLDSESNKRDIISSLPDCLLHHVLSFLETKFAVQTSIFSKRWKNVWTEIPCLIFRFDSNDYGPPTPIHSPDNSPSTAIDFSGGYSRMAPVWPSSSTQKPNFDTYSPTAPECASSPSPSPISDTYSPTAPEWASYPSPSPISDTYSPTAPEWASYPSPSPISDTYSPTAPGWTRRTPTAPEWPSSRSPSPAPDTYSPTASEWPSLRSPSPSSDTYLPPVPEWASSESLTHNVKPSAYSPTRPSPDYGPVLSVRTRILFEKFENFVKEVLNRRNDTSTIQKIVLRCDVELEKSLIEHALCYAVKNNAKEIEIFAKCGEVMALPELLYTSQALEKLDLSNRSLDLSRTMGFSSLKEFRLHDYNKDRYIINRGIIRPNCFGDCPVLEVLSFTNCDFEPSPLVISAPRLKKLEMVDCFCKEIVGSLPLLDYFKFAGRSPTKLSVDTPLSLLEEIDIDFRDILCFLDTSESLVDMVRSLHTAKYVVLSSYTNEVLSRRICFSWYTNQKGFPGNVVESLGFTKLKALTVKNSPSDVMIVTHGPNPRTTGRTIFKPFRPCF